MAIFTNIDTFNYYIQDTVIIEYIESVARDTKNRERIFNLPVGSFERFYLDNGLFAIEQSYITKARSDCFWETHRKYIDIQVHLDGVEQMEYIDYSRLKVKYSYDGDKDLVVYCDTKYASKMVMMPNDIAVYFPQDAHMGLAMYGQNSSKVFKTVIKFPVEMWKW